MASLAAINAAIGILFRPVSVLVHYLGPIPTAISRRR